ncbi:MAG: MG2 domain-containing protein, partial [Ferruginibacter sp.]
MKFRKIFTLLFLLFFNLLIVQAQSNNEYNAEWKKVDELEKKGLTQSALQQVIKIFDAATKDGNEAQQIKAAMYQMKYRNMVQEDNKENNIFYIDTLIAKTKAPAKNILQSMQAQLFESYRNNNRYKLYGRTALNEEKSNDITTWSIEKLNATIGSLYKVSLKNESILKSTSLNGLDAIIEKGKNTRNLRPTLYDFLAHRALSYFISEENDVTQPAYKFILNDEKIFAPLNSFISTKFSTKDSTSLYFNAILLLQDILKFHAADVNKDALIDADLIRLAFVNEHGIFTNKEKLYEEALKNIETSYPGNLLSAQAIFLRAQLYYIKGQTYNPLTQKETQFDIKKSVELCELAISKFPKSKGALNAQNLLIEIEQPLLTLTTEKVNIPSQPFRSLVKYKNVKTIYLRLIKTSRDEIHRIEKDGYDKIWPAMINLKFLKNWSVQLPDEQDYQPHSAEIKIDALPVGTYIILASLNANFNLSNNYLARQVTHVSNISYINNNKDELYVLDRDNGQPLARAEVQLWQQSYNYTTRKYEEVKKEVYIADKNGYIKFKKPKDNNYNNYMQVKYSGDELFTDDTYYSYYYNSNERRSFKKTFLFTDRSIYRPGQTVFFKGIVVSTDSTGKKSSIVTNYKTSIILFDANNQKAATIKVTSNEYGSYNGSLRLPEAGLNGQFYIRDSANQSTQYFSVEEYKRPKFLVEIKKPEGTYRINDNVKVTGNAKAYAGNNIDGAKVTYRVVRKVQWPVWLGWGGYRKIWPPYGNREELEITNGETTTDANGDFFITFKAIPDETVDKKDQPTFYYEVSADITDINGETRSSSTSVAVAYQALQLNIIATDKMPVDSFKNIKITSTNTNGLFEKARVNFSVYKLQSPNRIFRERYWEMPDRFVMTKEEYTKNFPYDIYADEDQVATWPIGEKVVDITDTTSVSGQWAMGNKKLESGWYKIIVTTKDKYGEEVKAEKYIQLVNAGGATSEPVTINVKNASAEAGQKINYSIATGFEKIWVIHSLSKVDNSTNTIYPTISNNNPYNNEINVIENDRGGMGMSYAFVQHNRVYSGNEFFSIPWSNKDLNISYETFRDKILPGSEEKWTIKISGNKAEKVAAETLISMYDASLDQFKAHSWVSLKSIWPTFTGAITWTGNNFASVNSEGVNNIIRSYIELPEKSYDELVNNGWNEGYYGRGIFLRGNRSIGEAISVEDKGTQVSAAKLAAPRVVKDEEVKPGVKILDSIFVKNEEQPKTNAIQIRKNFNETAFFFPSLITDANGNISFSFTIPEALTQWKMM